MPKQFLKDYTTLIFILLFFISLIVRLNFGYDSSFWLDEVWRISIARNIPLESYESIWRYALSFEGFVIINDLIFSNDKNHYRFLFVLISSFSSPLCFLLARNFFDTKISFIAGLLLSIHSWHLIYSNEIAAYAIGASLVTLLLLILFEEDKLRYSFIITIVVSALITLLHPYFLVLNFLIITAYYLAKYLYNKSAKNIVEFFIIASSMLLVNSGQIYTRFFEYSGTGAFNLDTGLGWSLGFPINLLNIIFLGPLENRWVPTSHNTNIIFELVAILLVLIFLYSIFLFLFYFFKNNNNLNSFHNIKQNNKLFVVVFSSLSYSVFIYLQAFFVNGGFLRYLLPIFPMLIIIIFYIFHNFLPLKNKSLYPVVTLMLFLNLGILFNGNFSSHYKNPYKNIFENIEKSCEENYSVIVAPAFLELAIAKFYLDKSECILIEQPSYKSFFIDREKNLIWQSQDELILEDSFILKEANKLKHDADSFIIISDRSKKRLDNILSDSTFERFKVFSDKTTDLDLRIIILKK